MVDITHELPPPRRGRGRVLAGRRLPGLPAGHGVRGRGRPGRRLGASGARARGGRLPLRGPRQRHLHPRPGRASAARASARSRTAASLRPDVSNTFHARDVFAPVAAHLARGAAVRARSDLRCADPVAAGPGGRAPASGSRVGGRGRARGPLRQPHHEPARARTWPRILTTLDGDPTAPGGRGGGRGAPARADLRGRGGGRALRARGQQRPPRDRRPPRQRARCASLGAPARARPVPCCARR